MLGGHSPAVNRPADRPDERWWRLAAQARWRPPRPRADQGVAAWAPGGAGPGLCPEGAIPTCARIFRMTAGSCRVAITPRGREHPALLGVRRRGARHRPARPKLAAGGPPCPGSAVAQAPFGKRAPSTGADLELARQGLRGRRGRRSPGERFRSDPGQFPRWAVGKCTEGGGKINCGNACSAFALAGSAVTLTAIAAKITDRAATGPRASPLVELLSRKPLGGQLLELGSMCSVTPCFYSGHWL
jgi:hypothetical protein